MCCSGLAATATCTDGRARVRTRVMAVLWPWDTWGYVGYVALDGPGTRTLHVPDTYGAFADKQESRHSSQGVPPGSRWSIGEPPVAESGDPQLRCDVG